VREHLPRREAGGAQHVTPVARSRRQTEQLNWVIEGERYFSTILSRTTNHALDQPSGLPGWSRGHVAAHVARNADALGRLVRWARTGEETPMYANADAREREIAETALLPPAQLRTDVHNAAQRLTRAWADLPDTAWTTRVRSALGRDIPVFETVWMRTREVWVHAVDLRGDTDFNDLPADVVIALLNDATAAATRRGGPSLRLEATDGNAAWHIGETPATETVAGPAHQLLGYVIGRAPLSGPAPALPRWL
jgi:maleylpyruvate isomerase